MATIINAAIISQTQAPTKTDTQYNPYRNSPIGARKNIQAVDFSLSPNLIERYNKNIIAIVTIT